MAHAAQHQAPAAAPKLLYRVHEATQALGVSVATIYRMCDRGELVKGKIGGTRMVGITAASVNAMLARMVPSEDADEASTPQMGS
ncbi:helix-turn-helix domain-containing protein [Achromobacter sp. ACM03]|uniref:helix-turn-helix domain-containing protein n=1 Tax=Achromobacter sp. ACM03 TaxID=2769300 RepID=UPI001783CA38|nr:helix-turn-helix domain-containing protein [Achromobacter sp. ACM03]MBD9433204.1 helix-turn-helix domain-containing protein [Achromobacter sp. ACM03]